MFLSQKPLGTHDCTGQSAPQQEMANIGVRLSYSSKRKMTSEFSQKEIQLSSELNWSDVNQPSNPGGIESLGRGEHKVRLGR
jgi:hypothetical protein